MTPDKKNVDLIGVPLDLGANILGAALGPMAMRMAGVRARLEDLGLQVRDDGDVVIPLREQMGADAAKAKFQPAILDVCEEVGRRVENALAAGRIAVTLGGDHSLAMGSIGGASRHFQKAGKKLGLIWFDAHGDLNTHDTSPSGNLHGMPLAAVLGYGARALVDVAGISPKVLPENVALVGIRTLDKFEKEMCRKCGIRYFTMTEIDEKGMYVVMQEALARATAGTAGVHVSFDIDSIDPNNAPGVSTPVPGGLDFRESHLALEMIAATRLMTSLDIVELNLMQDLQHKTVDLAVELVQSALGKSIV